MLDVSYIRKFPVHDAGLICASVGIGAVTAIAAKPACFFFQIHVFLQIFITVARAIGVLILVYEFLYVFIRKKSGLSKLCFCPHKKFGKSHGKVRVIVKISVKDLLYPVLLRFKKSALDVGFAHLSNVHFYQKLDHYLVHPVLK